jgi:hypothetical protein
VGLERGPLSFVSTTEELLERKRSGSGIAENTAVGIHCADHVTSSIRKNVGTNIADKRRSFGRYSSLAESVPEIKKAPRRVDVSGTFENSYKHP